MTFRFYGLHYTGKGAAWLFTKIVLATALVWQFLSWAFSLDLR